MQEETWKPIPTFPGYEVSTFGRIRSYYLKGGDYRNRVTNLCPTPQRILKQAGSPYCHPFVHIKQGNTSVTLRAGKAVLLTFVGPCPEGMEVCHNDGDRDNNHIENLRYDTHVANMRDYRHRNGKRMEGVIIPLRERYANGESAAVLGQDYHYSAGMIHYIARGAAYACVGGPITKGCRVVPLTLEQKTEIRERREAGEALRVLSDEYGVSDSYVCHIAKGRR